MTKDSKCTHEPTGEWEVVDGVSYAECKKCGERYEITLFQGNILNTPPQVESNWREERYRGNIEAIPPKPCKKHSKSPCNDCLFEALQNLGEAPQSERWEELDRIMHGANPVQLHTLKIHLGLLLDEVASSTRERTIAEVREKVENLDRDKPGDFGHGYNFAIQEVLSLLNDKGHG